MFRPLVLALLLLALSVPTPSAAADGPGEWICPPCGCAEDGSVFAEAGSCGSCGMELVNTADLLRVAIVLYPGVELLDFAGPGEVFAAAHAFRPYTVAASAAPLLSQGFVTVTPQYSIADAPAPHVLLVPGGNIGALLDDPDMMAWLKETAASARNVVSVCNGAIVLAEAGLLKGLDATTHWGAIEALRQHAPDTRVLEGHRWVDSGRVLTTAGVSAGIDGALHLVSRLASREEADRVARYMEYDAWEPSAGDAGTH